jgi:hypothetical protein
MTHLFNDGKYPWLPIIISIGSHAEIDLLRVWISIVSGRQLKNAVHHDDGSVCEKDLMDTTHLSGGARGTFCQSSAKRIESCLAESTDQDRPPAMMVASEKCLWICWSLEAMVSTKAMRRSEKNKEWRETLNR